MRRDAPHKEIVKISVDGFIEGIENLLEEIQQNLYNKACLFQKERTRELCSREEFYQFFSQKEGGVNGGFVLAYYSCDPLLEEQIKKDLNVTVRCLPLGGAEETGVCIFTGKPGGKKALFAKAY